MSNPCVSGHRPEQRIMAFPEDLSDILPLAPGTAITRQFTVFGRAMFVETQKLPDRKYRLVVYEQFEGKTRMRYGVEDLATEVEVESKWRDFLDTRENILRLNRDGQSAR